MTEIPVGWALSGLKQNGFRLDLSNNFKLCMLFMDIMKQSIVQLY